MKKLLAIILLVMLVMTATTVIAMSAYPAIYERDMPFKYCSLLDNGNMLTLETIGTQWTTTKQSSRNCYP